MRDHYLPGVPCWVDTGHPDPDGAVEFYRGLFGWELEDTMPPGSDGRYYVARLRGGQVAGIGSQMSDAPMPAAWTTHIAVANADEAAARIREVGGTVVAGPFDVFGAGRMAVAVDPEGAAFGVWQGDQMIGATIVNEPGTVNFNVLATRDAAAAESFYGSVFGWKRLDIGTGTMWVLPGYGDDLERETPGLRKRSEDMGAPEGFVDVVAAIQPIADDQPDTPARWGVTFGVHDTDAVAARAAELGGTVVAPPVDVPWSRQTVIDDPQGARFTASQFVPENKDIAG
jgi:predicted enzyme related to lactoylglutathione lyase